jgi:mitochondrial fission protein ELM1
MKSKDLNTCWIISEGIAGTENQCLGVAEALGVTPRVIRIELNQPWKTLSPYLGLESAASFKNMPLPPWPDLLIASGRKSIAAARFIKRASAGRTFVVQIQDPRYRRNDFDMIVVPAHDPARGPNVVVTTASPNRVTPARLEAAREQFAFLESLPRPRVAVLIGGNSKAHRITPAIMEKLCADLKTLGAGLMITASRRTGPKNLHILKDQFSGDRNAYLWDGTGENPYFGLLAWADTLLVTSDSVSMLSEAATTGKPVYMVPLEGGARRLDAFHQTLKDKGIMRVFDGQLEHWVYPPLRDAQLVAEAIKARF